MAPSRVAEDPSDLPGGGRDYGGPATSPDPYAIMEHLAKRAGIKDPSSVSLEELVKAAAGVAATDMELETVEHIAKAYKLPNPWQEPDAKGSKLGGPQQEAREFVPERQEREMNYPLSDNDYGDGRMISAPVRDYEEESMGRSSIPRAPMPNMLMMRRG
jgi:hypothetical protein